MWVIVIAGAAAGLLTWKFTGGEKLKAEIVEMEILTASGREVDMEDVPIDDALVLKTIVEVYYGDEGEASLSVVILDGNGQEAISDTFEVDPDTDAQVIECNFYIRWSEGETFTAEVELEAGEDGKTLTSAESLEFYVEEGIGREVTLEQAAQEAEAKLDEANDALVDLISTTDAEAEDLAQSLSSAYGDLEEADTEEKIASVYKTGEDILAECASRKTAWEEEQARLQEEERRRQEEAARQADISACQQAMYDYAWQTMTEGEPVRIDSFWMNDARTEAGGTMVGMATAHKNPEHAGETFMVPIKAYKQNGQWVASFVSSL
ncbi:MAG: hypothetical protein ACOC78_03225 [Actinomycetota bacterium]